MRRCEPGEAALAVEFAELFLSKASSDFLHERSTDSLAHMALGAFRFLKRARPERVDVDILNPDVDNEGWYAPVTVLRTHLSERPFIVDTIREFLHSQGFPIEHNIYPVLGVDRSDGGELVALRPSDEGAVRESLVHCEVPRITDAGLREALTAELRTRLQDVVHATDDFAAMTDAVDEALAELEARADLLADRCSELEEACAFLRWLNSLTSPVDFL